MSRRVAAHRRGTKYDYAASGRSARRSSGAVVRRTRSHASPKASHSESRPGLVKLLGLVVSLAVGLLAIGWLGWTLAPEWLGFKQDQQTLFISSEKDGHNNKIYYAIYLKNENRIHLWELDPQTSVSVIGGYGQYPLSAVNRLLSLEKKSADFVRAAYSQAIGVGASEVITTVEPAADLATLEATKKWWWQTAIANVSHHWQAWRWYWAADQVGLYGVAFHGRITVADLGREVRMLPDWLDNECSIAVVNTTAVSGLASQMARVLENGQLRVIRVTDSKQPADATELIMNDQAAERCVRAMQGVKTVLPLEPQLVENQEAANQYRADIVVLLGKDVEPLFMGRPSETAR